MIVLFVAGVGVAATSSLFGVVIALFSAAVMVTHGKLLSKASRSPWLALIPYVGQLALAGAIGVEWWRPLMRTMRSARMVAEAMTAAYGRPDLASWAVFAPFVVQPYLAFGPCRWVGPPSTKATW